MIRVECCYGFSRTGDADAASVAGHLLRKRLSKKPSFSKPRGEAEAGGTFKLMDGATVTGWIEYYDKEYGAPDPRKRAQSVHFQTRNHVHRRGRREEEVNKQVLGLWC